MTIMSAILTGSYVTSTWKVNRTAGEPAVVWALSINNVSC